MTKNVTLDNDRSRQPKIFYLSLLVACATFFLIIAGALVTSHDAGLATSDWPLSNGQVFPLMVGNLFWEHGHRMVATTVGLLTIVLTIYLWKKEERRWVRRLAVFALLAVVAQGLLGGLTVKLMLPLVVSAAHATLAQLFFCTTVSLAVVTAPSWHRNHATIAEQGSVPARYLCLAVAATIFLQLIIGATLRHSATWDQPLPTELLLAHLGGALAVTLLLAITAFTILRRHPNQIFLTRPAAIALALLGIQLLLGLAAYVTRQASPNDPQPLNPMVAITVAHVACGALVFATTIILTLRSFKCLRRTTRAHVNFINPYNDNPQDRGIAGADIYKMNENGKAIEHWDVLQEFGDPKQATPGNGMF